MGLFKKKPTLLNLEIYTENKDFFSEIFGTVLSIGKNTRQYDSLGISLISSISASPGNFDMSLGLKQEPKKHKGENHRLTLRIDNQEKFRPFPHWFESRFRNDPNATLKIEGKKIKITLKNLQKELEPFLK
jgi:hypothetical protein